MAPPGLFRFRVLLRARRPLTLHAHHGASVHATLAAAHGRAVGSEPAVPDGLWPDAPEQCRTWVRAGEPYAFGFALLADGPDEAGSRVESLARGLSALGSTPPPGGRPSPGWRGNFEVEAVEDLVAGRVWHPGDRPEPIPGARIAEESARVEASGTASLRFRSPLRAHRSSADRAVGHAYFDRGHFDAGAFARRLLARLADLGFMSFGDDLMDRSGLRASANGLVWLDVAYGPAERRKTLGGAVGRVVLERVAPGLARALVLGQYLRAGESTRFGFGAYRIDELGPEPYACGRSAGLLELALAPDALDRAWRRADLDPGRLRGLVAEVLAGGYRPPSIATDPEDRALQRLVLDRLAPGLDLFFEESPLAVRRGLRRKDGAGGPARARPDDARRAIPAASHPYFDRVDHAELRARLDAKVADPPAVDLLMRWVEARAPGPGRGLPPDSPVSAMLAGLFLDELDEEVGREGGRLVRVGDDFLTLSD